VVAGPAGRPGRRAHPGHRREAVCRRMEQRAAPRQARDDTHRPMTRTRSLLPFAEGALVVLSLTVVVGFSRLFVDGSFFPRLAAFALVAHLAAIATRRAGWSVAASGALSLTALVVTIGLALYPETTVLGIPTPD